MANRTTDMDVLIIGAGPAGAVTAGLLAREGHRVTVLEKEFFPRYHIGESMITGMLPVMEELGLREELENMGFPKKYGITLVWGNDPTPWSTKFRDAGRYEYSWHVRRAEFDALIANRAAALGADITYGATVNGVLRTGDGTVTGVRWRDASGQEHTTTARYTVDASGQARAVSRMLTRVERAEDLNSVAVWSYYTPYAPLPGDLHSHIMVEAFDDGWFWAIPVSEFEMSVGMVMHTDVYAHAVKSASPADIYERRLATTQVLKDLVKDGVRKEDLRTTRDWSYSTESFHGPGWMAVGDAAAFVDPLFSSGVWLGTSGAWLGAKALLASLADPAAEPFAMEKFENVYRQIGKDIFAYVRYFYDPKRNKEDYLAKANAATKMVSEQSELGFISLISGISSLPDVLNFDPIGADNLLDVGKKVGINQDAPQAEPELS
ncbi:NAD(P)/FAD-dependent oxidoreductase [Streptomyces montanisoli]|uniref:Tryptophan 7-halogenase n=1 Tax=Streptomyces montanisoli TaxID=2798581 RepID=A0A940RV57_9ACTN|nr:NAD(P)/FAD-dependent oxidoreductase [Streptomyces montanisoli]MBP0458692.1 tryptophan 7-halogenase [Streptomyces montanisoli]